MRGATKLFGTKVILFDFSKYSNVSNFAYTTPEIYLGVIIYMSYSSSILQQFYFISQTGLVEWWPKFINVSNIDVGNDKRIPIQPNMSGNILITFVFLGAGLSNSLACLILTFWEVVLKCIRCFCEFCKSKIRTIMQFHQEVR